MRYKGVNGRKMHAAYRKQTGVRQCSRVRLSALVGLLLAVIVPVAQPHEQPSGRGADEPGDSGSLAAPSAEMVLGQRLTVSEVMRVGHTRRAGGLLVLLTAVWPMLVPLASQAVDHDFSGFQIGVVPIWRPIGTPESRRRRLAAGSRWKSRTAGGGCRSWIQRWRRLASSRPCPIFA